MLRARTGFLAADLERNLDEPDLWALITRWQNVGSYRRALQGYESKVVVVPLLSEALDEPSAYEDPDAAVEANIGRGRIDDRAASLGQSTPSQPGRSTYVIWRA